MSNGVGIKFVVKSLPKDGEDLIATKNRIDKFILDICDNMPPHDELYSVEVLDEDLFPGSTHKKK